MMFVLSKLFWTLAAPGNFLVLAVVGAVALSFRRSPRARSAGRFLLAVVAVAALAIAGTPLADLVAAPLEERFPHLPPPERVDGIVMLGGAVDPVLGEERDEPSLNGAAERVLAFADLARRYPAAKAVFTGGSGRVFESDRKEDSVVRAALAQAGVPADRVLYENLSRNTWENAIFTKRLVDPQPGETWLLVTSALHTPRSVGIFRKAGWAVVAHPVDYRTRPGLAPLLRFDFAGGIELLNGAAREWIGLAAYRALGRTNALFPAP